MPVQEIPTKLTNKASRCPFPLAAMASIATMAWAFSIMAIILIASGWPDRLCGGARALMRDITYSICSGELVLGNAIACTCLVRSCTMRWINGQTWYDGLFNTHHMVQIIIFIAGADGIDSCDNFSLWPSFALITAQKLASSAWIDSVPHTLELKVKVRCQCLHPATLRPNVEHLLFYLGSQNLPNHRRPSLPDWIKTSPTCEGWTQVL